MTLDKAKQTLLAYRPFLDDEDPEVMEAKELAKQDPELGAWFNEHCLFQKTVQSKLRQLPVPEHLRETILSSRKIVTPSFWRNPVWLAAAAAMVLLIGISAQMWLKPQLANSFSNFKTRIVGTALRDYRMDIVTNDMGEVRQFLAKRGAPSEYQVPRGLEKLQLTGAGLLKWRTKPVSMVCFNRGDNQMLFLFVMNKTALADPPPAIPEKSKVHEQDTVSWTRGDKTYVLAGPAEPGFFEKYF